MIRLENLSYKVYDEDQKQEKTILNYYKNSTSLKCCFLKVLLNFSD